MHKHKPTIRSFLFPKVKNLKNDELYYVCVCRKCNKQIYLRVKSFIIWLVIEVSTIHFGLTPIRHNDLLNIPLNISTVSLTVIVIILCLAAVKTIEYFLISWKDNIEGEKTGDGSASE